MNTVRDIIQQAYKDSNVLGRGQSMTPDDLTDGLSMLNRLLDERQAKGEFHTTSVALPVTFNGTSAMTIGPLPDLTFYPTAPTPDIEVNVAPGKISEIIYISNAARLRAFPTSPGVYFSRGVDQVSNPFPSAFYYERTAPLATIRFMYGTPSGNGEIIYEPSYVGVDSNTDVSLWNRDLVAFLSWQLASDLAAMNRWDNAWLQDKASKAYNSFRDTNRKVQAYVCDASAPGVRARGSAKFNIYDGELV